MEGLFPGDAVRDTDGQITERNDNTDVFSIRVFAYDIEADECAGDEALLAEAGDACVAEFEDFVGTRWGRSVSPETPSGDRCVGHSIDFKAETDRVWVVRGLLEDVRAGRMLLKMVAQVR